ncbi:hypothetical protein HDC92_003635 [Pedobacter sp. AK017]|uniref:DUF5017 domain-containing protein n=1 Tax=Pedobacter sp. AK017 TaxID=2723073 RepID=UPI00160DC66D|nr:DUF5017 domain-containing protein [Pedobacter sp. AK017]MBB5439939.1 hypothetical protein [Pedobacter sp. AK017]
MKFSYYNMLLGVLLLAACNKELKLEKAPDFDVTTASTTYKAGQEITFNIKGGTAHIISFYSGETLKDYAFKDGRVIDVKGAGATLEFQNSVQVGTQAGQLSFLYSTDFNGDYSSLAKVKAATWTDITARFAPLATSATFVPATISPKDISDLITPGKPIYFAFKYVTKPQATNGLARQWFIQTFAVKSKSKLNGTALTITDQVSSGFRIVDENAVNAPARSSVTATRVTLYGNEYLTADLPRFNPNDPMYDPTNPIYNPRDPAYQPTAKFPTYVPFNPTSPYNDPTSEHWAVSRAISAEQVDLGPDLSTSIKGISNPSLDVHRYTYATPGTYKAVFVASNNTIDDTKTVIKEITLTITP